MSALTVTASGLATVQDLGRAGQAHLGISPNGAGDAWSARVANVLVGNAPGAPLIEVTGSSFAFRAGTDLLIAVTGAASEAHLDGARVPAWDPFPVPAGATVAIAAPSFGRRTYLAVNGRWEAEQVLGSVAPDHLLGTGRRLRPGDRVDVHPRAAALGNPHLGVSLFHLGAPRPCLSHRLTVDVTPGPDAGQFDAAVWDAPGRAFEVSEQSDHVGLRLRGPAPRRADTGEILSRGVATGTVEVPPGGGLIVLLRGRFLTAGYPVLAVATSVAIDLLGQLAPGDTVDFRLVSTAQARADLSAREAEFDALAVRVAAAFGALGLSDAVEHQP